LGHKKDHPFRMVFLFGLSESREIL
jgi:hypothetical protein